MPRFTSQKKYPLNIDGTDLYFVTEQGIQYHIYLTEGADYLPEAPFSHLIQMIGFQAAGARTGSDDRVRDTILEAIQLYFEQNPDLILTYVCDMMDSRQRGREQLFDKWYQEFKDKFNKLTFTDGQTTYCGMLFRAGHPHQSQLESSVEQYIQQKTDE